MISSLNQPPTITSQIPFFFIALCWWLSIFPPSGLYLTWPHLFGCARTLFCHFRRTGWHTRHFRLFRGFLTSHAWRLTMAPHVLSAAGPGSRLEALAPSHPAVYSAGITLSSSGMSTPSWSDSVSTESSVSDPESSEESTSCGTVCTPCSSVPQWLGKSCANIVHIFQPVWVIRKIIWVQVLDSATFGSPTTQELLIGSGPSAWSSTTFHVQGGSARRGIFTVLFVRRGGCPCSSCRFWLL